MGNSLRVVVVRLTEDETPHGPVSANVTPSPQEAKQYWGRYYCSFKTFIATRFIAVVFRITRPSGHKPWVDLYLL